MPLQTDLSVSPYFDDYREDKDYYKVLFRPSVSVQVRELNQLQTILQKQIERFGDNVFKRGTIINGCNFVFFPNYPYVKILDNDTFGAATTPVTYVGKLIKNSANLNAIVVNYYDGFETADPDLKTLYIHYNNSGNSHSATAFSPADILSIYDSNYPISKIRQPAGPAGIAFSNNDTVVVTSSIITNTGSSVLNFIVGDELYQSVTNASLTVVAVDNTTLANSGQQILQIIPLTADLANSTGPTSRWVVANSATIRNFTNSVSGMVESIVGHGAEAVLTTDFDGRIISITMANNGFGYTSVPMVSVKSANNTVGLGLVNASTFVAQNFIAKVKVANTLFSDPVGNGYAFSVSEGVIYQKGTFLRVAPQIPALISKYSAYPDAVAVGFTTIESLIDSNIDPTLLDNAIGTENVFAPGANRMKMSPELIVLSVSSIAGNEQFFPIVEWAEGIPFKQNQYTVYNRLGDEMARRTFEGSGNYVIDKFNVSSKSPQNANSEGRYFNVVVDPGMAYISGERVKTIGNYSFHVEKGTDTQTNDKQYFPFDYGNYIRITEVGGVFQFSSGDLVNLYDTRKQFISNTALITSANTDPQGTLIGSARARSFVLESGTPGTAGAVYRMYLFDIIMNSGSNFRNVKSVYYDGALKGISDIALEVDASTNTNIAIVHEPNKNYLIFGSSVEAIKNANNFQYVYRTIDQSVSFSNNGLVVKDISANPDEIFPYLGALGQFELETLYLVPVSNSYWAVNASPGTASINATSSNAVGTSTTFLSQFVPGDYVYFGGTDGKRVVSITNNTLMTLDSVFSGTNASSVMQRYFPKNVPIPLGGRLGLSANVDSNGSLLTVNLGFNSNSTANISGALAVNISRSGNSVSGSKSAVRDRYVKIRIANSNPNGIPLANSVGNVVANATSVTVTANFLSSNLTGNVAIAAANAVVVGTSTLFTTELVANQMVMFFSNSTVREYRDILSITNSTYMTMKSNLNTTNTSTNIANTVGISFANAFSNGDYIALFNANGIYTISQVNTVSYPNILQLTSNSTVVNSTGMNFAQVDSSNILGPWCIGVTDVIRMDAVYVANSVDHFNYAATKANTNSLDCTFDFYIDHNQNSNYYGLGFLYVKPNSKTSLELNANTEILVRFDWANVVNEGIFTTPSYVGSNATTIYVNDSKPLANLLTSFNTHEIPEFVAQNGQYYDLMNQFDLRPHVSATAVPTANSLDTALPINPPETLSFGNTSDPANDKKYPLPGTQLRSTIEQYIGRMDSVFVSKDGSIFALKGVIEANPAKRSPPHQPAETIKLNDLIIPPYPSVPKNVSNNLAEILTKHMANERLMLRRTKARIIQTPYTQAQIEIAQPEGYSMEAIGNLERRIKDLEYYVSLNLLESSLKDKHIPSSIDPSLNRFKFGFFADDFSTTNFVESDDPQYSASIEEDKVVPKKFSWSVEHKEDNSKDVNGPYIDWIIIEQDNATTDGNVANNYNGCLIDPTLLTTNITMVRSEASSTQLGSNNEQFEDIASFTASANGSGSITLYFENYSRGDKYLIYQGNTLIQTSNSAINLTVADKTYLKSDAFPSMWFVSATLQNWVYNNGSAGGTQSAPDAIAANGYVAHAGKLIWSHIPSNGRTYTIKTLKGSGSPTWRYAVDYPIDTGITQCPPSPSANVTPTAYVGVMDVSPKTFDHFRKIAIDINTNIRIMV